jgi:hypothetical protein
MNVVAAQVLSGVLFERHGNCGLAEFLGMAPKDRLSEFSAVLGGEMQLVRAGHMLDQPWNDLMAI